MAAGGLRGEVRPERGRAAPRRRAVVLEGRSAREVHRARDLARLVTGRALSDAAADDFVLWCWRERVSGEQLLAEAREAPPVPEHPPLPPWCGEPDPATRLVGPWREPGDLEDGLELLEEVVRARQGRVVRLGRGYARLAAERLHLALGFDTLAELARQALGLSLRTLERYRRVAEAPGVEVLGLARAELVAQVARPDTEEDWVRVAGRTTLLELRRAVDVAGRGLEAQVLAAYRQALDRATDAVALGSMAAPPPAPGVVAVHPDLPEAASWFLEHVRPVPQRGFGKVKERDRFVCQNPECGRRSLRSQAHHIRFRSDGGEDALDNGLTLCPPCHLRLVHTGRVAAERTGDGVVWRYPGGRSVTVFGVLRSQPADEVSG